MSSDASSPIYPDRPIRPLPKRRLRERLSPEAADSIRYPQASSATTPLFYYPYSPPEDPTSSPPADARRAGERHRENFRESSVHLDADELESDDEEDSFHSRMYSRQSSDKPGKSYRYVAKQGTERPTKPQTPGSTASSIDGYDSFENTNNKKKRKVPSQGDGFVNGAQLTNELANMELSGGDEEGRENTNASQQYATGSPVSGTHGISGSGRGRYGRVRSGRSPLRALSDATNNWTNGRLRMRQSQWSSQTEGPGIISTAIANAEREPLTPPLGQENVSLLQQVIKKPTTTATQFTFTCDPQDPATIAWPGPETSGKGQHVPEAGEVTSQPAQRTQRLNSPNRRLNKAPASRSQSPDHADSGVDAVPKKSRRRPARDYAIAARQRREHQEYLNAQNRFSSQETWICEFCEYESIFGTPPVALIRQYEMKDARLRKQEAERRRLLEKAKMKGRKGKKSAKATSKHNSAQDRSAFDGIQRPHSSARSHSQETQSEGYYEDEYDDEYVQDEASPLSPSSYTTGQDINFHYDTGKYGSTIPPNPGDDPTIRVH